MLKSLFTLLTKITQYLNYFFFRGISLITMTKIRRFSEQIVPFLLGIFLFLNPFPHITTIKELCFYLSGAITVFLVLAKRHCFTFKTPLKVPLILFTIWAFLGLYFALNRENSWHDFCIHWLKYVALYFLLINWFKSKKHLDTLCWIFAISAAVLSLGIIIYFYVILSNILSTRLALGLSQISPNTICIPALFAIVLSLHILSVEHRTYRKVLLCICLLSTSAAISLSQSRGALIALIVSAPLVLFKNRKTLASFAFLFVLMVLFLPIKSRLIESMSFEKFIESEERICVWRIFSEVVKDYPVAGVGFGMLTYNDEKFMNHYNQKVPLEYRQATPHRAPHNMLLDTAVRTGVIGLLLFLYLLFSYLRMNLQAIKKERLVNERWGFCIMAAFLAIVVQGMFENTLSGPPAILLFSIFALGTITWRTASNAEIIPEKSL